MKHYYAVPSPFRSAPLAAGSTQHQVSRASVRRLVRRLIVSDHLALRLAASATLVGGVAQVVWWALGLVAAL